MILPLFGLRWKMFQKSAKVKALIMRHTGAYLGT